MNPRLTLIAVLIFIGSSLQSVLPQESRDGAVEFTLTVAGSSAPLPGGSILMMGPIVAEQPQMPAQQLPRINATTDKDGHASLANLAPGRYLVSVQKEGFLLSPPTGKAVFNTSIIIDSGKPAQKIAVSFIRGVTISGTISDANGAPVVGANVNAAVPGYRNGRRILKLLGIAKTDDRGNYRMYWFGPGEYYIVASVGGSQGDLKPELYPISYYPGTMDAAKAKTVTIRGGEDLTNINFALQEGKPRHVRGKVLISPERAIANGQTEFRLVNYAYGPRDAETPAFDFMPASYHLVNRMRSDKDEFDFLMLPGSWDLYATISLPAAPGGGPAASMTRYVGRTVVDVSDKDIDGLSITAGNVKVKGRIVIPSSLPLPAGFSFNRLELRLQPRDVPSHMEPGRRLRGISADGSFEFSDIPPGNYSLALTIPPPLHIADIRVGSKSLFNDGVFTAGAEAREPIQVILGADRNIIRGNVVGIPQGFTVDQMSSMIIVMAPAQPRRQNTMLYRAIQIFNLVGAFTFSSISPGEYKIFAFEGFPEGIEFDPSFLARHEKSGRSVAVASGQMTEGLQIELIRNAK